MALSIGQAQTEPTTGMSGAVWEALKVALALGSLTVPQGLPLRKMCEAIAKGVVDQIHSSAVVSGSSIL